MGYGGFGQFQVSLSTPGVDSEIDSYHDETAIVTCVGETGFNSIERRRINPLCPAVAHGGIAKRQAGYRATAVAIIPEEKEILYGERRRFMACIPISVIRGRDQSARPLRGMLAINERGELVGVIVTAYQPVAPLANFYNLSLSL
jgi:hypothetical protein